MGKFNPDDRVIFKGQTEHVFTVVCNNAIHDRGRNTYQLAGGDSESPDLDWIPEFLLDFAPVEWNEGDVIGHPDGLFYARRVGEWVYLSEYFSCTATVRRPIGPGRSQVVGNVSKLKN